MKVAVIDAGRKERRKYFIILLLYLLILNCGIAQSLDWTGLDWFYTVKGILYEIYLSSGVGAVMVMVMVIHVVMVIVSSHVFY